MSDGTLVVCEVETPGFGRCRTLQLSDRARGFETERPLSDLTDVRVVKRGPDLVALLIHQHHCRVPLEELGSTGLGLAERIHAHGHVQGILFEERNLIVVTATISFYWETLLDHVLGCLGSQAHQRRVALHEEARRRRTEAVLPLGLYPGGSKPLPA